MPKKLESNPYKCKTCKDQGYTFKNINGYEVASKCKCKIREEIASKANSSGLEALFDTRTFDNYIAEEVYQKSIKDSAIKFTREFIKGNKSSFAILGQSGVGKTHIMTAVAEKLIDHNMEVKYYIADEIVQKLSACKYDEQSYNIEFNKIANAGVLFIDDLFKSSIRNYYKVESIEGEDLREIFKVINYRYNKNKPILLNSEIHYERFAELDQALIGRINEMCQYEHLVSIKPDPSKNYRLKRR